ncbi:hypothetical protein ScPMuIL_015096 [Solemya velum]
MVNVIPRKRLYRMETVEEMDIFKNELLKRPLVIQPEVISGTAIKYLKRWVDCGLCVNRGRIQMGVDIARKTMTEGEPFVLEFNFSQVLKRLYHDLVSVISPANSDRDYADCEFGDVIVRYPGDAAHQSMMWNMKARHFCFAFEDLEARDMKLRTRSMASSEQTSPVITRRSCEELYHILPGWVFITNEDSDSRDPANYGYDQSHYRSTEVQAANDTPSRTGRIKGRSQRGATTKYEVPVELHVPVQDSVIRQHISQEDGFEPTNLSPRNGNHRSPGEVTRQPYHHHAKQASGSGRSAGSSAADSGYEGHEAELNREIRNNAWRNGIDKYKTDSPKSHFDNPAYDSEVSTDDILEQHKALAAKMLQQKVSKNERTYDSRRNYYDREMESDSTYHRHRTETDDSERELNIQYRSGYRNDSQSRQVDESFI